MHPVFLHIGSFELASYGLMTALGYAAAALYLLPRLKKVGLDQDTFWNLIFIAFIGALAGSKLLYIIVSWPQLGATLAEKLTNIVRDIRYGFVFFGGMIVSVGALVWYIRKKKLPAPHGRFFDCRPAFGARVWTHRMLFGRLLLRPPDGYALGGGVYQHALAGAAGIAGHRPASHPAL